MPRRWPNIAACCATPSRPTAVWRSTPKVTRSSSPSRPLGARRLGEAGAAGARVRADHGADGPAHGTPTVAVEGYVGIDVHRAARVAALAHGGQVIVSATTAALLEDEPLRDLGRHRLKDFDALAVCSSSASATSRRCGRRVRLTFLLRRLASSVASASSSRPATVWLERDPRLLTIIGPGGTGKTRFSIELARFLAEEADGGTVFVPLAPVRDAAAVVPLIAERLGASGDDAAAIATRIGETRAHVVLDNLEQLLPDAARSLRSCSRPLLLFASW